LLHILAVGICCLNWGKLMQILKNNGVTGVKDDYQLTVCGSVLVKDWTKKTQGMWRLDEESVRQGRRLSPISFNLYNEYLTKKALDRSGDFKTGHVIHPVKYADDFVLLAKEETIL
jgi:hypothetical protein